MNPNPEYLSGPLAFVLDSGVTWFATDKYGDLWYGEGHTVQCVDWEDGFSMPMEVEPVWYAWGPLKLVTP